MVSNKLKTDLQNAAIAFVNQIFNVVCQNDKNDNSEVFGGYEDQKHREVVEKLARKIYTKRVSIRNISDWSGKNENYLKTQLPQRSKYTNTFWAVDVVKFLCDLWSLDYPPEYFEQCEKYKISA